MYQAEASLSKPRSFYTRKSAAWLLFLLTALSRIPAIFNNQLILDGDECIVGIMAKWIMEGKEIHAYFLGQNYGFALLETLPLATLFYIFEPLDTVQKSLGVLFFAGSAVLLFAALRNLKIAPALSFVLILLFVFSPSWQQWSVKITGGYLSALFLSSLVFYLSTKENTNLLGALVFGCLLTLLYEAQRLWLPFAGMCIFICLVKKKQMLPKVLVLATAAVVLELGFLYLRSTLPDFWQPKVVDLNAEHVYANLLQLPERLYMHFTGTFYYNDWYKLGLLNRSIAVIYTVLALMSPLTLIAHKKLTSTARLFLYAALLAVFVSSVTGLVMPFFTGRYFLPLQVPVLLAYGARFSNLLQKPLSLLLLSILVLFSSYSYFLTSTFTYEWHTKAQISALCQTLKEKDYKAVYCTNALLQWQINYYSQTNLPARYFPLTDRDAGTIDFVDAQYKKNPASTAIVGFIYNLPAAADSLANKSIQPYFYFTAKSDSLLRLMSFELREKTNN